MSETSKEILKKIDEKHIKPTPKWQFVVEHVLMWVLFILTIIIGSIATGIVLFSILSTNWDLVPRLGGHIRGFFLVIPYLWIGLLALVVYLASTIFTKTKKGYKHSPWLILAVSVAISIVLGSIMFATRMAHGIEDAMRTHLPQYKEFQEFRKKIWQAPEQGVLPGKIIRIESDKLLILDDLSGKRWEVDIVDAKTPPQLELERGLEIIAVGEKTSEDSFKAEGIRPARDMKDRIKKVLKNGLIKPPR